MKTRQTLMLTATLAILLPTTAVLHADTITWDAGGDGASIYQEANWDQGGADPVDGTIDGNTVVNHDLVINFGVPGGSGATPTLRLGNSGSLTVTGGNMVMNVNNAGIQADGSAGGAQAPVSITGGSVTSRFFTDLNVTLGGLGTAVLHGPDNPLNNSAIDIASPHAVLRFNDETPTDYAAEHLGKTTVNGAAAVVDSNLLVTPFNGATGSEVTIATDYALAVKADAPAVWYKFNENTGNSVMNNSAGTANTSTNVAGATFGVAGIEGRAGDFTGLDNVTLDYNLDVSTSDFSIELLIRPDEAQDSILVQQLDGTGLGRSLLRLNSDGSLRSIYGGSTQALTAAGLIETGQWAHVVLTVEQNGTTDAISIYVNGVLAGTGVEDGEAADGLWRLGAGKTNQDKYDGLLDEFAVYESVLTPTQISEHFAALSFAAIPTPAALPAGLMLMGLIGLRRRH